MRDGFIRVAAATPALRVADCNYNAGKTIDLMREAERQSVSLVVFPELGLSGYTCQDLFLQPVLLQGALEALETIVSASEEMEVVAVVGLPLRWQGKLYNCAVAVQGGEVLGVVPKSFLPNYGEFYEQRWFVPAPEENGLIGLCGSTAPFGTDIIFSSESVEHFSFALEICEDLWAPMPPSSRHAIHGATILANLSASDELVGKAGYKRQLVCNQSGRLMAAYLYAGSGAGESTGDMVFAGHNLIAENGILLAESEVPFEGLLVREVDLAFLANERMRTNTFTSGSDGSYDVVLFSHAVRETELRDPIDRYPFVPSGDDDRSERCKTILMIQSVGLGKRLLHTGSKKVVIGLSGGLDSTVALLVAVEAFDRLALDRTGIIAITMPCFGTTERTRTNAWALARSLGVTIREIDITKSVMQHFSDISHDPSVHDVTFENSQARERTQVLMDVANKEGALVIGTGDLSELALGWATYNGDHMSMYGVNAAVPKTLIRHLVSYVAKTTGSEALRRVLTDVLDTPVSPELLPARDGVISQVTEDIVGPYELHDFFLYHMLRRGSSPAKVFRVAKVAFQGSYDDATILKWLRTFYRRFFSQQFKRSCLPDGPKVGSVALSPRGDLRMPSDACATLWLEELDQF